MHQSCCDWYQFSGAYWGKNKSNIYFLPEWFEQEKENFLQSYCLGIYKKAYVACLPKKALILCIKCHSKVSSTAAAFWVLLKHPFLEVPAPFFKGYNAVGG